MESSNGDDGGEDELMMTFWEHLDALRKMIVAIAITIGLGIALSLFFYSSLSSLMLPSLGVNDSAIETFEIKQQILYNRSKNPLSLTLTAEQNLITKSEGVIEAPPRTFVIPSGQSITLAKEEAIKTLSLLSPLEGMQTMLKICFWSGIAVTSPFWLLFVAQFIAPALHWRERKILLPFFALSIGFMGAGALFAKFVTIPIADKMFYSFNAEIGVNVWSFSHYVDYTLLLMFANSLSFEIALVMIFLVKLGVVTANFMQSKRRHMILAAFIFAALITPPDILTQVMLAIPLIAIYEATLLYARYTEQSTVLARIK